MKLSVAIVTLAEDFTNQHPYTPERISQAKLLGIEAMKRIQDCRIHPYAPVYSLLTGESMPGRDGDKTPST